MSVAELRFRIPEEQREFLLAAKAGELFSAVHSFEEWLRKYGKHEDLSEKEVQVLDAVRRIWFDETSDVRDLFT